MKIWHLTAETPRQPHRVAPGERARLLIGSSPVELGQAVWVEYHAELGSASTSGHEQAVWHGNRDGRSEWVAELGPFPVGALVQYTIRGRSGREEVDGPSAAFRVAPRLYLALLWHQHQPLYKDPDHPTPRGGYREPWVRLHALRDYYSMAALVAEHPRLNLTINLTPILLWQIEDYLDGGATDRALDLTLRPVDELTYVDREWLLSRFFDADWHNQIFPHPRYKELFVQRQEGRSFSDADLRDVQMWFNLAWFAKEFREGDVELITGEKVSVRRLVEQQRDFTAADIESMVAEQYKILRAVVPVHRALQKRGQVEISTTPLAHPILPLLMDSDAATLDRPGAHRPARFAYPADAAAQVTLAVEHYRQRFGRAPRGMWPAEGAVSQSVVPLFARAGARWIATDQGVLARSGRWGYRTDDPDVLCQPYQATENGASVSVFFRHTGLSDAIGFRYHAREDAEGAAGEFLEEIRRGFARELRGDGDRVLTVALDGENAWGAYREDARPFLHALYALLERETEIETVTFAEYLDGNPRRAIQPHPPESQPRVYDLFTGSWIDENGSAPGVDLGTWIGEEEENRAWELLGAARAALERSGATPDTASAAFDAVYAAEGSDWFWWLGSDQDSGSDGEFEALFRAHLQNVYRGIGVDPDPALARHIVPRAPVWTFTRPIARIQAGDRLVLRMHCPGVITWWTDGSGSREDPLVPAGGVMAGVSEHHLTLGPFGPHVREVRFRFRCTHPRCSGDDVCCRQEEQVVRVS